MADFYPTGTVRLYYRSRGGRSDANPTARITGPGLQVSDEINLGSMDDGIYWFEHKFTKRGSYLVVFYENSVMTTMQHLEIGNGIRRTSGDGLINI